MFRHVLVPVDLTDKNLTAISAASDLASSSGARVSLLHVIETIEDADFEEFGDFYRRLEEKAQACLGRWAERLAGEGVEVRHRVLYGRRTDEILRFAEDEGVDLIVLSSHRVDPEQPGRGWGTLSYRVALLASSPVLLVK